MKKIPLGLCSSVAAVFVWLGIFGALAVVSLNQLFFFKHPTGLKLLGLIVYVGTPTILGLALLGVGLAIGSLRQADRRKTPAVLGLVLNGLFLLSALVLGVVWGRGQKWGRKRDGKAPAWDAPSLATSHRSDGQEQKLGPVDGEDWTVPGIGMMSKAELIDALERAGARLERNDSAERSAYSLGRDVTYFKHAGLMAWTRGWYFFLANAKGGQADLDAFMESFPY